MPVGAHASVKCMKISPTLMVILFSFKTWAQTMSWNTFWSRIFSAFQEKIFLNDNTLQDLINKQLNKKLVQTLEHENKSFPAKRIYTNCVSTFMLFRKSAWNRTTTAKNVTVGGIWPW